MRELALKPITSRDRAVLELQSLRSELFHRAGTFGGDLDAEERIVAAAIAGLLGADAGERNVTLNALELAIREATESRVVLQHEAELLRALLEALREPLEERAVCAPESAVQ